MMPEEQNTSERLPTGRRNRSGLWLGVLLFIMSGMFVFAYANAAFFVNLCQSIGLIERNPQALRGEIVDDQSQYGREVDVFFQAVVNDQLPLQFSVKERKQSLRLGEMKINDYKFINLSKDTVYFRPVHRLLPQDAAEENVLILQKCFCFDNQVIGPGETYTMPVQYTFTKDLDDSVFTITMRYELFPISKEFYESSVAATEGEAEESGSLVKFR